MEALPLGPKLYYIAQSSLGGYHWRSMMLRLVEPTPLYKAAILAAVAEMQAIGEWDISPDAFAARFDDILHEIAAAKDPATAPPGVIESN